MVEFMVIDLGDQARFIARYVKGWSRWEILDWLEQFGKLELLLPNDPDLYIFRGNFGLTTVFRLVKPGEFIILGDNTARRVTAD